MGESRVQRSSRKKLQIFEQHLLNDLHAMQRMLEEGWFEIDKTRIGAEQEFCLVDKHWKLSPHGPEMLKMLDDERFTHEFARFNLEANLPPFEFKDDCFTRMEDCLKEMMGKAAECASRIDDQVIMTGIVPTVRKFDLSDDNITPTARYYALCDAINKLRGNVFELRISGIDELIVKHDSPLLEAANTGFQVHLQVKPDEFVDMYNIAQAITGPVLAACTFSPILFRKRLWSETRVALFQQTVDTRHTTDHLREQNPRVTFGSQWLRNSILDIYKEDIIKYRVILSAEVLEDVWAKIEAGQAPDLMALKVHNSTVYRWNRACYGISNNIAHLRIENRIFPAGPTILDEVANAAFWCGLMKGMYANYGDITQRMDFSDAKKNFFEAARTGLDAHMHWMEGRRVSSQELILGELLPLAEQGLKEMKVKAADRKRYLQVIEDRVASGKTGTDWMLKSLHQISKGSNPTEEDFAAITAGIIDRQKEEKPVHEWEPLTDKGISAWEPTNILVEECMTRDLVTVQKDDILPLVAEMMDWQTIRYVLVENDKEELVGLVSSRTLLREFVRHVHMKKALPKTVKEIMIANPLTVGPDSTIVEAMEIMEKYKIGCLPVVKNKRLVGVVTEKDFLEISSRLIKRLKDKK